MAEKKKKFDASKLESAFKPDAKGWKALYSRHEKAVKAAYSAVKDDTTGLDDDQILDQVAKFMHTYHAKTGKAISWEKMDDGQRDIYRGKAHNFLVESMKDLHADNLDQLMSKLHREGLDVVFDRFKAVEKQESRSDYSAALIRQNVKPREQADELYDHLNKVNPQLVKKAGKPYTVKNSIAEYLRVHYLGEHEKAA